MSGRSALFADAYQLTTMYTFLRSGHADRPAVFDLFIRQNPFGNGYTVLAGLEQAIEHLTELRFTRQDEEYIRSLGLFADEAFFRALRDLRFTGTVMAMPEGTVAFPHEPLARIQARLLEGQLIETALLATIGHQTLIATKAHRIVRAAGGKPVLEFGARRAHGGEAAMNGARAAIIAGCAATSNLEAGMVYGLPVTGTHPHSMVMVYGEDLPAFQEYCRNFPDNAVLLVDTFDTLRSGVPSAIRAFDELVGRLGRKPKRYGVRIDSGDLAYLAKGARRMLDAAGHPEAIIALSSDLDEHVILALRDQGAPFDVLGVGTRLITANDQPALGDVYKLGAVWEDGDWRDRIKVSANPDKITIPGVKQVTRLYQPESGLATADLISRAGEVLPDGPFPIFDPVRPYLRKWVTAQGSTDLLVPVIADGQPVYRPPSIPEVQANLAANLARIPEEVRRFSNPHVYHVDLSQHLWEARQRLMQENPPD